MSVTVWYEKLNSFTITFKSSTVNSLKPKVHEANFVHLMPALFFIRKLYIFINSQFNLRTFSVYIQIYFLQLSTELYT